jgi:hypothetical protein
VRKGICVWLCLLVVGAIGLAAQRGAEGSAGGESLAGTWTGTWDSASSGSGGFELTLEKGKDGAMTGRVSVTGEPTYKATFASLSFDGARMNAKYDFPPSPEIEVLLAATFDGNKAAGTWTAREKANGNEVTSGTWKVTRKE